MSENDGTFCKNAGGGYESGIVHDEEGVMAVKYTNGKGSMQQRLRPGQRVFHLYAHVVGERSMGMP